MKEMAQSQVPIFDRIQENILQKQEEIRRQQTAADATQKYVELNEQKVAGLNQDLNTIVAQLLKVNQLRSQETRTQQEEEEIKNEGRLLKDSQIFFEGVKF